MVELPMIQTMKKQSLEHLTRQGAHDYCEFFINCSRRGDFSILEADRQPGGVTWKRAAAKCRGFNC